MMYPLLERVKYEGLDKVSNTVGFWFYHLYTELDHQSDFNVYIGNQRSC